MVISGDVGPGETASDTQMRKDESQRRLEMVEKRNVCPEREYNAGEPVCRTKLLYCMRYLGHTGQQCTPYNIHISHNKLNMSG
jgi:hypothetical protein